MSWKEEVKEILIETGLIKAGPLVDQRWKEPLRSALNTMRLREKRKAEREANPSKATKAWRMKQELKAKNARVVLK